MESPIMFNESLELSSDIDEFDNLFEEEGNANNLHNLNNIFPFEHNLNQASESVIINRINPPNSFREVSVAFGSKNVNRILKLQEFANKDSVSNIAKHGKRVPILNIEEVVRIIESYVEVLDSSLSFDDDTVVSFINLYGEGKITNVLSYYFKKANSKRKRNLTTVGRKNITFKFNVDKFRELHFGIAPDDMNFNPLDDREMLIIEDYVRVFWELYMLLVFYRVCEIAPDNEDSFFKGFHNVIKLAMITGMKMFVQFELNADYGELYEELKGFKPINEKYLFVEDIPDKRQIHFVVKNSDFLTEAYVNEYRGAINLKGIKRDIKADKHVDTDFYIMQGSKDNTVLFEVTLSGQNPIGRIYSGDTDPETVINFADVFHYCPVSLNSTIFLFRQMLNYSKDNNITSYYTVLHKYLEQFKGRQTRNVILKYLSAILLILYKRPSKEELEQVIDKYFKDTDKEPKAEFRKMFNELVSLLQPKERLIDKLRKELWRYVW